MNDTAVFSCSICDSESRDICVLCTKDTCPNHLCLRCRRCSDCCICETPRIAATFSNEPVPRFLNNGHEEI